MVVVQLLPRVCRRGPQTVLLSLLMIMIMIDQGQATAAYLRPPTSRCRRSSKRWCRKPAQQGGYPLGPSRTDTPAPHSPPHHLQPPLQSLAAPQHSTLLQVAMAAASTATPRMARGLLREGGLQAGVPARHLQHPHHTRLQSPVHLLVPIPLSLPQATRRAKALAGCVAMALSGTGTRRAMLAAAVHLRPETPGAAQARSPHSRLSLTRPRQRAPMQQAW